MNRYHVTADDFADYSVNANDIYKQIQAEKERAQKIEKDVEQIGTALALSINGLLQLTESQQGMQEYCGQAAKENGWHDDYVTVDPARRGEYITTKVMLIVSELAEAVEELRSGHSPTEVYYGEGGKPEGFPVELADAIIRAYDLAEMIGIELDPVIEEKVEFNKSRGRMHGGKSF